jgi:hypothetical protein
MKSYKNGKNQGLCAVVLLKVTVTTGHLQQGIKPLLVP